MKPVIAGLIDMQTITWHNQDNGQPTFTLDNVNQFPGVFGGIVLNATWGEMQLQPGGPLQTARIDAALDSGPPIQHRQSEGAARRQAAHLFRQSGAAMGQGDCRRPADHPAQSARMSLRQLSDHDRKGLASAVHRRLARVSAPGGGALRPGAADPFGRHHLLHHGDRRALCHAGDAAGAAGLHRRGWEALPARRGGRLRRLAPHARSTSRSMSSSTSRTAASIRGSPSQ